MSAVKTKANYLLFKVYGLCQVNCTYTSRGASPLIRHILDWCQRKPLLSVHQSSLTLQPLRPVGGIRNFIYHHFLCHKGLDITDSPIEQRKALFKYPGDQVTRASARIVEMPVQNSTHRISAHPIFATQLLRIRIPTILNSQY